VDAENATGFLIDGKVYEVPALWDLTMAERRLLFDLSGFTQEDFLLQDGESDGEQEERVEKMMRHPGYVETLMTVAYQRGNPGLKPGKVRLVIDGTNYMDAIQGFATNDEPEADEVPLALTSEPEQLSAPSSLDKPSSTPPSSATGGTASANGSDEPDATQIGTGTSRLDTSSISVQEISAA
jgi:hypothetical protein